MRLAMVSPLTAELRGSHSHSAYFTEVVLPELAPHVEVELFRNSFIPHPTIPSSHYLTLARRHEVKPFDVVLYQVDAHPSNRWVRVAVGLVPGTILFHDFVFRDFGPEPVLNSAWRQHIARFRDPSVPWPVRDGEFLQRGPFGFREAAWGIACGFTSPRFHDEYLRNIDVSLSKDGPEARSFYIPFPVPTRAWGVEAPVPEKALRVAFAGSVRPEHRAHNFLRALKESRIETHCIWLVDEEERIHAQEMCAEFGVSERVTIEGPRSIERWQALLARTDLACHLAFTAYDQLGPFCSVSLTSGCSVAVLDYGDSFYLSNEAVWKVTPGEYEHAELAAIFESVLQQHLRMPHQELEYLRATHHPMSVARELVAALDMHWGAQTSTMRRWESIQEEARKKLFDEALALSGGEGDEIVGDVLSAQWKELGWIRP